jgi:vitamin-K-epoxide reductase (warfarin-sensitive)
MCKAGGMPLGLDDHFLKYVVPLVITECCLWKYAFASDLRTMQVILGLVGLWWCFAALWVEVKIAHVYGHDFNYEDPPDPQMKAYKPFCDFAPWANCSKVLMSPPGRFLRYFGIAKQGGGKGTIDQIRGLIDVPNPTLGVAFFGCHLFYPVLLLLGQYIPILGPLIPQLFFLACCFVGCMTIWLAYNLFFVLKDFCVVCVSMYVANFALIPMMYGMQKMDVGYYDMVFWGAVPDVLLYPFLVLDAIMGVAVLKLFLSGPAHAREPAWLRVEDDESISGGYLSMTDNPMF